MTSIITLRGGLTTQYLLPCTGGYLQVEAGDEKEFSLFLRKLKKAGVDPRQIRYLFLTHHHGDHAGFTSFLREVSGCRVIAHKEAAHQLNKGKNAMVPGGGLTNRRALMLGALLVMLRKLNMRYTPVELKEGDMLVEGDDNELLRSLGIPGKILHTPGHTPDSLSLLLDDGSCFCGDAAMSRAQWALGTRYCCIIIDDMEENYRSWRKMIGEGARTFYPAHGAPFTPETLQRHLDYFKQDDLVFVKR